MSDDDLLNSRLRDALRGRRDERPRPDCPRAEDLVPPLDARAIAHAAVCSACREDVVVAQRLLAEQGRTERVSAAMRARLRALTSRRSTLPAWIAAAAAAALLVAGLAWWNRGQDAPKDPVARRRPEPSVPALPPVPIPPETPTPAPPRPVETPAPPAPPPPPVAPPRPETPAPLPPKATTVEAPAPPAPDKLPPPPPTVAKRRGALLAVAGGLSLRNEGGGWQGLKIAQSRDFTGALRLRADAPAKAGLGGTMLFLQRGTELSLDLEEGRTLVRLDKGEALFDVPPGGGAFVVETPAVRVTVKGTRFLVAADGEVVVQRGGVETTAEGRTASLERGERNVAAGNVSKADLSKRLAWTRWLEEVLAIEAELMTPQNGMVVMADPTASGGRALTVKAVKPGQEPAAELRARRKQPVPYAAWIRYQWSHGVPPGLAVQIHETSWTSKEIVGKPDWQWVRIGTIALPDDPFRIRLSEPHAGSRIDQILLTSDPDFDPATERR